MFTFPVRVYYEDTDAAGVVYYANYLKFIERARTEYLAAIGHPLGKLERRHGIVFVVRRVEVDFLAPHGVILDQDVGRSAFLQALRRQRGEGDDPR